MGEPPTYLDGQPTNLEAAALDALEWLRAVQDRLPFPPGLETSVLNENRLRLRLAIKALERLMPDEPPVFNKSKV